MKKNFIIEQVNLIKRDQSQNLKITLWENAKVL